jgi:sulfoxide reductase heme-binding subunit YedZ
MTTATIATTTSARPHKQPDPLKMGVTAGAFVPLVVMFWRLGTGAFTDPIAQTMNQTGLLGLILLIASLACTPLKMLFQWTWAMKLRKLLGLLGFFYICLHFLIYLCADQFFDFKTILEDIFKRPFITVGFSAFLLLIPLAWTSTNNAIRRMGAKNWRRLHKLAYLAAMLGILHFVWRVKTDFSEPATYGAILGGLLFVRILDWGVRALKKR